LKGRGTQGVIAMQVSERNGALVGGVQVFDGDELMLISDQGTLVRIPSDQVSLVGRNTQGVRLIAVRDDERLVRIARIVESEVPGGDMAGSEGDPLDTNDPEDAADTSEVPESE
jgi:DNA gyrase subunit A